MNRTFNFYTIVAGLIVVALAVIYCLQPSVISLFLCFGVIIAVSRLSMEGAFYQRSFDFLVLHLNPQQIYDYEKWMERYGR